MHQRWLRILFRRRVLTILLLLLQVWFLVNLVIGGSQLSQQLSRLLTIVSIVGGMWSSILEVLKRKASQGVTVRLIYDDMGCFFTLPNGKRLYGKHRGEIVPGYSPPVCPFDVRRTTNG